MHLCLQFKNQNVKIIGAEDQMMAIVKVTVAVTKE